MKVKYPGRRQRLLIGGVLFVCAALLVISISRQFEREEHPYDGSTFIYGRTWYGVQYATYTSKEKHAVGMRSCGRRRESIFNIPGKPATVSLVSCIGPNAFWFQDKGTEPQFRYR